MKRFSEAEWEQHYDSECTNPEMIYCKVCEAQLELRAREETLREVIAWVRGGELAVWIEGGEHDGEIDPDALADEIERRFITKP